MDTALFTLLHLLIFAYWLGGDIGVFYASTLLTDDTRDTAGRLAAGKILTDVDLAPRFCLLLALPTGLVLASSKGWLQIDILWLVTVFIAALAWIYLVIQLHIHHVGMELMKRIDTYLRIMFLLALIAVSAGSLLGLFAIPLFIALKLLVLAFAVSMGLVVRQVLKPFGPAYVQLATAGADAQTNAAIKETLDRARPAVILIWIALIIAAWLGVTTPV